MSLKITVLFPLRAFRPPETCQIFYGRKASALAGLLSVTANGQTTTFTYDGDGNRVKMIYPNLTVYFVGGYYKKAGGNVHKYYFLGGQPVATRQAGVLYYLHGDHLGSVSLMTTDSGGI